MSTGLPTEASAGSAAARAVRVASPRGSTTRPSASQASVQRIAGPPAFVTMATRLPLREWLAAEQRSHVEHLADRVGTNHARVAEERVDRGVSGREQRAGVRRGGALAGGRAPALDDDDGLAGGDAPRDAAELGRVAEGLEVERDDIGALVRLPVLKKVVTGEVRLVAGRDERGQADAVGPGKVERGDAECPALGGEAHPAGRRCPGREARVQRDGRVGVDHAEAVGAHEAHAGGPAHRDEIALSLLTRFAHLGEPRREDHEGADACGGRSRERPGRPGLRAPR